MLALEAPLLKLTLAAGALATIAALAPARHHHPDHARMHKLVLHTEHHPDYVYLSVWELNGNDVWADVDRSTSRRCSTKFAAKCTAACGRAPRR